MKLRLYPNNKKRLSVCPVFVRYRFLQNHWTEFDETLHALFTLPDDVKNAKKIFKKFSKIGFSPILIIKFVCLCVHDKFLRFETCFRGYSQSRSFYDDPSPRRCSTRSHFVRQDIGAFNYFILFLFSKLFRYCQFESKFVE